MYATPCRCSGASWPKRIEYRESNGFSSAIFYGVPALICPKCGEWELDGDDVDLLLTYLDAFPMETAVSWGEVLKWSKNKEGLA